MINIDSILAKLGGISFFQLESEEQVFTATLLRPSGAFTLEQRQLMADWFLVVPPDLEATLATLNEGQNNIAQPVILQDNTKVLHSSLLSDCRDGETFGHLREFLFELKFRQVLPSEFVFVSPNEP